MSILVNYYKLKTLLFVIFLKVCGGLVRIDQLFCKKVLEKQELRKCVRFSKMILIFSLTGLWKGYCVSSENFILK